MLQKNKFSLLPHRQYHEEEPTGTYGSIVEAIEICEPPEGYPRFVIVETDWAMAHPGDFHCYYYSSEADMRAGFKAGLIRYLTHVPLKPVGQSPEEKMVDQIFPPHVDHYANHAGFIRSFATDGDKAPWFLAKEGEEIEGDMVRTS